MKNTTQEESEWTSKELLEFYKSFSHNSFAHACLQDREMRTFIHTACYFMRSDFGKRIYFEKFKENYVKDIISASFHGFLQDLEEKIESGDLKLFEWVFKDSDLYLRGGIFSMEEAVYAMRDEVLGVYLSLVKNRLGHKLYQFKEQTKHLKDLMNYNPKLHKGTKYNCYKNHLITDWYGQMILGSSMIFQGEINLEETEEFDSFCDKFEPYFTNILDKLEIDGESFVNPEIFSSDIKKILDHVLEKNDTLVEYNYELV